MRLLGNRTQDTENATATWIPKHIFRDKASDTGIMKFCKLVTGVGGASALPDPGPGCPGSSTGVLGQGRTVNVRRG